VIFTNTGSSSRVDYWHSDVYCATAVTSGYCFAVSFRQTDTYKQSRCIMSIM